MAQIKETMAQMIEHQKKQKRKEKERSRPAPSPQQPLPPINIVMPTPPVHTSAPQVSALEALRAKMMR